MWPWIGFTLFVIFMLALDLGVLQRRPHLIGMREALAWFGFWVGLALLFNIGICVFHKRTYEAGLEFFTGFLVEKSLSIDTIFVFILIFDYFRVPPAYQHKVLFWGIVGAIIMRMLFIVAGLALLERFHWTTYLFGAFLLLTGLGMMIRKKGDYDPAKNWVIRAFRRVFPVTDRYEGNRFFTQVDGRLVATPLFIVLLAVESSDIIFAADSIPAILAITPDPFIVYTSNIFAMLGLRSLYFAVARFMQMFHFLHYGFASIIIILGGKMLLTDVYKVPVLLSLALIVLVLLVCIIISLLRPRRADLKLMFERTERLGLIHFRSLLLIENIIDLGELKVRDSMRTREAVHALQLRADWEANVAVMRQSRFSRYPVLDGSDSKPMGVVLVKDLYFAMTNPQPPDWKSLVRPIMALRDDLPLEEALARFQRRGDQMAMVLNDKNDYLGIISIEDVLEEIVGKIDDEFDRSRGRTVSLSDALSPGRVVFELQAQSMKEAIREIVERVARSEWPADPETITSALLQREETLPTYVGQGLAVPHGRLDRIDVPVLAFARSDIGVPIEKSNERAELFFMLLTPRNMARLQPRLLADIAGLFDSDYVTERLRRAKTPEEVIEAIGAGLQIVLD